MTHRHKKRFREKRKTQRINFPIQIKYKLLPRKKILNETFAEDISGGGVRIRAGFPLKKGDRLKALLHFPNGPVPITAFTEVVRCRRKVIGGKVSFDIGMRYVKIIPKDRERFTFSFCETMMNYFILRGKRR